jgi:hypothetical protein
LIRGYTDGGSSLLELHRVTTSSDGNIDESLGDSNIAIVIDTDFGDDKHRFVGTN